MTASRALTKPSDERPADARERAYRLDGALEAHRGRTRALERELDAERRTAADRLEHAARLRAQLLAGGVDSEAIPEVTPPRPAERQNDLELDRSQ